MSILRLIPALALGAVLSQFPAFSDQYVQRLGGQVDALQAVAADFDASAEKAGYTREQALSDLSGSDFQTAHQGDMRQTFARLDKLSGDLTLLRTASPLERMLLPHRLGDMQTLRATWADFVPAVPVSFAGLAAGGIGFVLGWILAAMLGRPFRRRDRLGWR
ncbi:DUF2937 family protein [Paracoccus pacificus]|uniref:DUF2937 family protein n=1 Tax=Paracoccus pacificus TaxID=1463598 RepID=A0ABW4RAB6_9RHOB